MYNMIYIIFIYEESIKFVKTVITILQQTEPVFLHMNIQCAIAYIEQSNGIALYYNAISRPTSWQILTFVCFT